MAASARSLLLYRFNDIELLRLSLKPPPPSFLSPRHRPPLFLTKKRETLKHHRSSSVVSCLFSGIDGAGDFVSTQNSGFRREFSVLANILNQIEPLDTSIIAKGISNPAKDSMKRTISTMLGLLPSDQFDVTIRVSKQPLDRLLASSIITGYTLWNAEYRVSLMRNFDSSVGSKGSSSVCYGGCDVSECEEREGGDGVNGCKEDNERKIPQCLGDLSPAALNYIQELKSELATAEQKLNAQKQENMNLECNREENNDLLEYLRSLEPNMVTELSQPSSSEVEEIIQQLVQNILQRFFKDDTASAFLEDSVLEIAENSNKNVAHCDAIGTSRDYLAKLLFWCMLLGHHMRGLEYRLQLSCVVGLL
ncbi:seed maturation-like protein [Tasmannia lanceolata]|uniref:seed maturation-like protein n=1 Tax=Tasmannia lanceolata TaxID=3420 RepID=UPI004063A518